MNDTSWTRDARALLDQAAARHGGWSRWERVDEIRGRLYDLGGAIPWAKGLGNTFASPEHVIVRPREWRAFFDGVERPPLAHRESFRGWRKWRRWRQEDAAYFFGCAISTYWSLPFVLARTSLLAHDPRRRTLTVEFPAELDSHCRRQRFWFADDGLLVRHDYHAEIVSTTARGAHVSAGYVEAGGLWFATERRVYVRLGRLALPMVVLRARFADLAVT